MTSKKIGKITIEISSSKEILDEVHNGEIRGLKKAGPEVEAAVRNATPLGPTGNYKRSIGHEVNSRYRSLNIFSDSRIAPHNHLVEFGTVHSRANPTMRRSVESLKRQVYDSVAEELEKNG